MGVVRRREGMVDEAIMLTEITEGVKQQVSATATYVASLAAESGKLVGLGMGPSLNLNKGSPR